MNIRIPKKLVFIFALIVIPLVVGAAFWFSQPDHQEYSQTKMRPGWNLSKNILNTPNNRQFAQFFVDQEIVPLLDEKGPYTVFVPSDAAYNNLPAETKEAMNNDGSVMRAVLLFHVVEGKYTYADLKDGMELTTVQGEKLSVKRKGNEVSLNGYSYVENYDLQSTNGIIHTVTNFLLPGSLTGQ